MSISVAPPQPSISLRVSGGCAGAKDGACLVGAERRAAPGSRRPNRSARSSARSTPLRRANGSARLPRNEEAS
jgi:hypothetical protein